MGPTALLPLRRKACWGVFRPKNPTASAGCDPANLGTKGQHATSRPPKPLFSRSWRCCWSRQFYLVYPVCVVRLDDTVEPMVVDHLPPLPLPRPPSAFIHFLSFLLFQHILPLLYFSFLFLHFQNFKPAVVRLEVWKQWNSPRMQFERHLDWPNRLKEDYREWEKVRQNMSCSLI